jgi:hypothetical protein
MTDKGTLKREYAKKVYGPLQERTLRNGLIKKLIEGYGYSEKISKRYWDAAPHCWQYAGYLAWHHT